VAWPEWHLLKGIFQAVHGGDGSNLSHFCFFGWPFSRTCSRASGRGLVISGNALGRRLRCLGSIRPGLSPTRGFAMVGVVDVRLHAAALSRGGGGTMHGRSAPGRARFVNSSVLHPGVNIRSTQQPKNQRVSVSRKRRSRG
jgi:hypothetical protein